MVDVSVVDIAYVCIHEVGMGCKNGIIEEDG